MTARFAFVLCLLPQIAWAEIVPINLGEQGDYTRLVLTLPDPEGWEVAPLDRRLEITVPKASGFDTAAVDNLIGSRIANITQGGTPETLRVQLNCDCTISSYVLGGLFLTIDVAGQLAPTDALPSLSAFAGLAQPWHTSQTQAVTAAPQVEAEADRTGSSNDPETTLDALDTAVSTGIASATYQGFLTIPPDALERQGNLPLASTDILDNIAVGIQSQLSTLDAQETSLPDIAVFGCRDVSARLSAAWQTDHSFSIERGAIHSRMITSDEEETPNDAARLDLAILLVGQGLGYEALALLDDLGAQTDLSKALTYMATVLDKPELPAPMGLENCPEDLAFWAYLHGAGESDVVDALDPRSLMLTFKLLPEPLQTRTIGRFGDALARAGQASFQAELQDFKNTAFAISFSESGGAPPTIDFERPASAHEVLRAELTERDLDPEEATPHDPTQLSLELLDGLRIERRGTEAEPALLDAVLARHVDDRNFIEVLSLLIDGQSRIAPDLIDPLMARHLGESIAHMTAPELLAFAFRSDLPPLPDTLRSTVAARLTALEIPLPPTFSDQPVAPSGDTAAAATIAPEPAALALPVLVDLPETEIPTFAQSEELLAGSEAVRNAIETLINDTN